MSKERTSSTNGSPSLLEEEKKNHLSSSSFANKKSNLQSCLTQLESPGTEFLLCTLILLIVLNIGSYYFPVRYSLQGASFEHQSMASYSLERYDSVGRY